MEFLTNNLEWSAQSIVELYRCRWQIEVFFADLATGRLPWHQRQCGALTGVDGAAGLSAVALSGVSVAVEPQLQPAVHFGARGLVEKMGRVELAAPLWDSRRPIPLSGPARAGVSAGLGLNLWDSPSNHDHFFGPVPCDSNQKLLTPLANVTLTFQGNPRALPAIQDSV